jgi:site-specific DNA recombinase
MTRLRFAGYVRVSRVAGREGESFLSPTLQRERMSAWSEGQGHDLVSITEDLDVSGASTSRTNLEALIEAVESGNLNGVVVASLDRLGRSLPYAIALIDRINRAGGQFVSVVDGFDTRTPYGELALNVMLSVAQFEVKRISAQWRNIVERNIAAGRHPGPMPPFGYSRGENGVLVANEQAPIVREIFVRAATGESLSSICRALAARKIESQRGQRITRSLVHVVLKNRAYLGEARSGDLVNPAAHEALVNEDLWRRAQSAFRGRPASKNREPALYAGLIRCQGCRYVMAPTMRDGKRRYKCLGNSIGRSCPAPAFVTEAQLVAFVEAAFFERLDEIVAEPASVQGDTQELVDARDAAQRQLIGYRDDAELPELIGYEAWKDGRRLQRAEPRPR